MRTPERKQLGLTKCHNMMMKNAEQTTNRSSSFFRRTSHRNSSERFKAVIRPFQPDQLADKHVQQLWAS